MAEKRVLMFAAAAAAVTVAAGARLEVAATAAVVATLASFYSTRRYWINADNFGLVVGSALVLITLLERALGELGFAAGPQHLSALVVAWGMFGHELGIRRNPLVTI